MPSSGRCNIPVTFFSISATLTAIMHDHCSNRQCSARHPRGDETVKDTQDPLPASTRQDQAESASERRPAHNGLHYTVSSQRGKACNRVRYIEGTMTTKGCRFL